MLKTLQIISLVLSIPGAALVLLTTLCKPFRLWIIEHYRGKDTDRCLLRDRITCIYYQYNREHRIKLYEYENLEKLYAQYKKLGGNSFVDKIWEEIQEWTIDR